LVNAATRQINPAVPNEIDINRAKKRAGLTGSRDMVVSPSVLTNAGLALEKARSSN
jgi:hypothetical protein